MPWNCNCCDRVLPDRAIAHKAYIDGVGPGDVGSDCIKKIKEAGEDGYQHKNGPLCFSLNAAIDSGLLEEETESEED